jgi:hypothetical protein
MKDLVDHIRTVHFTVLVVALILTASLQFEKRRPLERAAVDMEAISHLAQHWPDTVAHLETAADEIMDHHSLVIGQPQGVELLFPEPGLYQALAPKSRKVSSKLNFGVTKRWIYVDETAEDDEELLSRRPKQWTNLREFFDFWDSFHDGRAAFIPLVLGYTKVASDCNVITISAISATSAKDELNSFLVPKATRDDEGHWSIAAIVEQPHDEAICKFPSIAVPTMMLDLPHALMGVAPQAANWGTGKSSAEFSELIAQTKYLETSSLDGLAAELRERANSDTERIELFQAKLPTATIAVYGSLVLIICQFYLLAHLIELREIMQAPVSREWPTGYIGLYKNRFIFLLAVASLTVWPLVPIALSVYQSSNWRLHFSVRSVITWLSFGISVVVGMFSAVVLSSVRNSKVLSERRILQEPAQPTAPPAHGEPASEAKSDRLE